LILTGPGAFAGITGGVSGIGAHELATQAVPSGDWNPTETA
jgi:hypothetical protein